MKQKRPAFIMFLLSILFAFTAAGAFAGKGPARSFGLPVKWGELTAPDFIKAVERSAGLCLIPIGVFEKPGPHLPLGTGLIDVREIALRAARKEYALCLPGILFQPDIGSKTPPGTIAYSPKLAWDILRETCDEISRNGIKKIVFANGHGGNNNFLPFFNQAQLEKQTDY